MEPKGDKRSRANLGSFLNDADRSFSRLASIIATSCVAIRDGIPARLGSTTGVNVYGEHQIQADVWANDLLTEKLLGSGLVRHVASEELSQPRSAPTGEFSVVYDPIDGSSNVASDNPVGTIVGVYRDEELPARGDRLYASMYFLYGPYTQLVLALEGGVYSFTDLGGPSAESRFVLAAEGVRIPDPGEVYGVGGSRGKWSPKLVRYVDSLEAKKYKLRYSGCFVADYNQVLCKGGFFAYPELSDAPQGKYRLQYESNPLAFITEKAGGVATDGRRRILEIEPESVSQRTPTYLGSPTAMQEYQALS